MSPGAKVTVIPVQFGAVPVPTVAKTIVAIVTRHTERCFKQQPVGIAAGVDGSPKS